MTIVTCKFDSNLANPPAKMSHKHRNISQSGQLLASCTWQYREGNSAQLQENLAYMMRLVYTTVAPLEQYLLY